MAKLLSSEMASFQSFSVDESCQYITLAKYLKEISLVHLDACVQQHTYDTWNYDFMLYNALANANKTPH